MLPQQWPNPDYHYLESVIRVKPRQLHQMAVSTNPSLGGHVIQLVPPLSDTENYWGFQGYSPFQIDVERINSQLSLSHEKAITSVDPGGGGIDAPETFHA